MPKGRAKSGIGIEITGDRINLVKLTKTPEGVFLAGARSIKLPTGKKEDEQKLLAGSIIKAFEGLAFAKDGISLGVGGHMSFVRKVKLPPVSHSKLKQVVSFEVQQQVPFSLNEVLWDYQVISPLSKVPGPVVVLIAAIKQSFVEDLLKVLQGSINKTPDVVDTSSLALHNCLTFNESLPKEKVGILVNLGFSYTDVSIENKGEMAFTRAVPIGKKNILKKIAESRGVALEQAEEILKKEDVSSIILSVWEDLVAEIKRTTNYYLSQVEKVTHFQYIYTSGGFPKDTNLINLLQNSFSVEVKEIDPFTKIGYDPAKLTDVAGNFCVSTGLALRVLEHFPVEINLLPAKLLNKRQLASKRLYFIPSFVVLFLIAWVLLILGARSYNLINQKINMVEPIIANYKPYMAKVEELKNERQNITSKIQNIEAFLKQKSQLSALLLEVSKLTPTSIYITEISTGTVATETGTRGGISGSGRTTPSRDPRAARAVPSINVEKVGVGEDVTEMPSDNAIGGARLAQPQPTSSGSTTSADRISLSGITASYPTVDEYIKQLKTSPLFKTVELISVSSTLEGGSGVTRSTSVERTSVGRGTRLEAGRTGETLPREETAQKEEVNFKLGLVLVR